MKKIHSLTLAILACAISQPTFISAAYADDVTHLEVSRIGDTDLNCGQLSQEAVLMRDIVATTEDIKDGTERRNMGITAAGAVGSFLVSSVTGGLGIAAAGYLLQQNADNEKDEADNVQDIAEQRRSLMVGIYNAKGCHGPMEHVYNQFELDTMLSNYESSGTDVASIEPASGQDLSDHRHNGRYND